jgi:hypothetical protein
MASSCGRKSGHSTARQEDEKGDEMKPALGILGILAASIGTAQAQFNNGTEYRPDGMGGYTIFDQQNSLTPMGTIEPDGMGGFVYKPNMAYRPSAPANADPDLSGPYDPDSD